MTCLETSRYNMNYCNVILIFKWKSIGLLSVIDDFVSNDHLVIIFLFSMNQ